MNTPRTPRKIQKVKKGKYERREAKMGVKKIPLPHSAFSLTKITKERVHVPRFSVKKAEEKSKEIDKAVAELLKELKEK